KRRTKRTRTVPGADKVYAEALHPTAPTRGKSQNKEEKPEPCGQPQESPEPPRAEEGSSGTSHQINHVDSQQPAPVNLCNYMNETIIAYPVLPVLLKGPKGEKKVYAMLDKCSAYTIIDAGLADELGLEGEIAPLDFKTIEKTASVRSKLVNLEVENIRTHRSFSLKNVQTFPTL